MKSRITILLLAVMSLVLVGPALAADEFNPAQKTEIGNIIHKYLLDNPQVLIEVSQALQQQERQAQLDQAQKAISENAKQLSNTHSPVAGNEKGNVTLVEFFDYQCGHCKTMGPVISNLINSDPQLRVVFKEFPIFGATSEFAAKAALAAKNQEKYLPFHEALLQEKAALSNEKVLEIAKNVGLDVERLQKDLNS